MNRRHYKEIGTSMIEMSFTILFFVIAVITLFDFTRYFVALQLAQVGLQDAVNYAAKLKDIKVDLQLPSTPMNDHTKYYTAQTNVVTESTKLALATLIGSWDQTNRSIHYVRCRAPAALGSIDLNAVLVQPGGNNVLCNGVAISHPTKPSRIAGETLADLLPQHPLYMYTALDFRWLIPGIPNSEIVVSAAAFAEPDALEPMYVAPAPRVPWS